MIPRPSLEHNICNEIIATSQTAKKLVQTIRALSKTADPILLIGRRGTGKDFYARLVNALQNRTNFYKVDCGQNEEQIRKLLFGYFDNSYAEIAYDPEDALLPGVLEHATGGTVYLDRINLAPKNCIGLLLNALQNKPYSPVGRRDQLLRHEDVQFVASCELHPFVDQPDGYVHATLRVAFRERVVVLPPMQHRKDDIPRFIQLFAEEIVPGIILEFSTDSLEILSQSDWSRNLYDLKRVATEIVVKLPRGGVVDDCLIREIHQGSHSSRLSEPEEHARQARCAVLAKGLEYQNAPVSGDKVSAWIEQFSAYRGPHNIDPRDVAEHLLRAICERYFYDGRRLKDILQRLFRQMRQEIQRDTNWKVAYRASGRDWGEFLKAHMVVSNPLGLMKSPDAILPIFRSVSGLSPKRNSIQFDRLSERIRERDEGLAVILVDDFIGTGNQFLKEVLERIISDRELCNAIQVRNRAPVGFFVLVCVAYEDGLVKISEALSVAPSWLRMTVLPGEVLTCEDKAFYPDSRIFSDGTIRKQAREIVLDRIGGRLHHRVPGGWGDLQSLVVFSHNTPNNTLPVVWKNGLVDGQSWLALFPRLGAG